MGRVSSLEQHEQQPDRAPIRSQRGNNGHSWGRQRQLQPSGSRAGGGTRENDVTRDGKRVGEGWGMVVGVNWDSVMMMKWRGDRDVTRDAVEGL
jgi:hypothetical protein